VNNSIAKDLAALVYTTVNDVLYYIRQTGRSYILIKRDVKDAFRNIPIAIELRRILAFE